MHQYHGLLLSCVGDNVATRLFPVHVGDQILRTQCYHPRPRIPRCDRPRDQGDGHRKGRVDVAKTGHWGCPGQRLEEDIRLW